MSPAGGDRGPAPLARLLLVEDNPDDALLFGAYLQKAGLSAEGLTCVERLSDAIEALSDREVDCVLLDLTLPDADGLEAVTAIAGRAPGLPLVVLTGRHDEALALAALRAGAQDFLVKDRVNGAALWRVVNYAAQRQRATESLRRSEERFARAFEAAPHGMALVGLGEDAGRFVQVNRALCRKLGREPSELLGLRFADITHPDDVGFSDGAFTELVEGAVEEVRLQKRYLHADGSTVHVEITASLILDDAGDPAFVIAHIRDITERVLAQEENDRLEQSLRQAQRMETVGQLAGGVAHDFNNLLSVIRNYTQFTIEALGDHPAVEDLREVAGAAERAAALTHQLLVFSRRDAAKPSVLDLNEVIGGAAGLLRRTVTEDIELELACGGELPVLMDRSQLEQVLLNLVVNARDAISGGGTIRIESHRAGRPGGEGATACLRVSDSGAGMTPEVQARIFDPFYTTKAEGTGTGLGLATVYGIVSRSGGSIEVDSTPGSGTVFTVSLPLAGEPVAARESSPVSPLFHQGSVLLVEDEDSVRKLTRRVLEDAGYDVVAAENGERALEVLDGLDVLPDAVVTDVVMPRMGGVQLYEELRRTHPSIGVVFMSGYTDRPDKLPADARFVAKPLDPHTLLGALADVSAQGRASRR